MRLIKTSLSAAGSAVQVLNPHSIVQQVLPILYGSNGISATAQVDGTISNLGNNIPVIISQTTTTITVTFPSTQPHTLGGSSDYVVLSGTGNSTIDGTWAVATVSSATVLTITSGTSQSVGPINGIATPIRFALTVIASAAVSATVPAVPARSNTTTDLGLQPWSALILKVTTYSAGTVYLDSRQYGTGG